MRSLDDNFSNAILETVGLPLLALAEDLRVEAVNEAFLRQFAVAHEETVGRLVYQLGNGQWDIPELRRLLGEILPNDRVVENYRVEHVFEGIGRKVMRLNARRIRRADAAASILLAIHDDTERERLQFEIEGRIEFADKLIDSVREALLILGWDLRVHSANQVFYDLFNVDRADTEGRLVYELGNGQWDIPALRRLLEDILPREQSFDDYEVSHTFETIGERAMLLNGRRLDHLDLIVLAIRDITGQRESERARHEREARQAFFLKLSDALRPFADADEIVEVACRMLAEHLGVDRAYFVETDEDAGFARVARDFVRGDAPSLAGEHRIADFAWSVAILRNGDCHVIADVRTSDLVPPAERPASIALQIIACMGAPLIKADRLVGALCVTDRQARAWSATEVAILRDVGERIWAAVERARAEAAVLASGQVMRQAIEAADAGTWTVNTATGAFVASDRALELNGLAPGTSMTHERALACIHPDDRAKVEAALQRTIATGEPFRMELRVPQPDGSVRWLESHAERHAQAGQTVLVGLVRDISERKAHEAQVRLLMREVNHRSKNMLGLVQAIARQTVSTRPEDFLSRFDERIQSLAAAQDLFIKSDWKAVPLADLVRSQLGHFADLIGGRIRIAGPSLLLTPSAAQSIALAVHELATNAAKHGALSTDAGRVDMTWHLDADGDDGKGFRMRWEESGGPPVARPAQRGFGSSVMTSMVEMGIGGTVTLDYAPTGLTWTVTTAVENVADTQRQAVHMSRVVSPRPKAASARVLVVEDEPLLATDMAGMLETAGFEVVGPAGSVARALSLIHRDGCDAAVLDFSLRHETSEPLARHLSASGTPFLVATGYSRAQLPEAFQSVPILTKPIDRSALEEELRSLLRSPGAYD